MTRPADAPRHTIHVISHTHWDREWYLPFEKHRRRLVALFDKLLDLLDTDPDFAHFHTDGQIIPLEDYLEIRPQALERIRAAAAADRLSIGPWYVLQDEFLTSGEANVRNMMLGLKMSEKFGRPCLLGYLPDSFGNIGQMPQILRGFGIDNAVFGRGVNAWREDAADASPEARGYKSEFSWQAPDGSEVLGVFMANWYANAMTIPSDPDEVGPYIEKTRDACLRYATTSQLLFMNGCDHTPSQPDISTALKAANEQMDDAVLLHSSFDAYLEALRAEVGDLQTKTGEMRSEYTDGWGTLTNVLSSRLYQKRANWHCQTLLEKQLEPLSALAWHHGLAYDADLIWYAWKTLMQNHPHDSICGCSCDEVHAEMDTRFEKCRILAEQLAAEALDHLADRLDTAAFDPQAVGLAVFNPSAHSRRDTVEACVDFPEDAALEGLRVLGPQGQEHPAHVIEDLGRVWDYHLPEVGFRQTFHVRRLRVAFEADLPPLGLAAFEVLPGPASAAPQEIPRLENAHLRVDFHPDGRFDLTDKATGRRFGDLHHLEDSLDVGDEYNYRAPADDRVTSPQAAATSIGPVLDNGVYATCTVQTQIEVQDTPLDISYTLRLGRSSRRLDIRLELDNAATDHRLRVLFPTEIAADCAFADGQFEVVQRPIDPSPVWENPSNCQPQQAFVGVHDAAAGLVVANRGLPEYEILRDGRNTVALTLLRAVGQLGDWGVFPTPQAQCPGPFACEYALIPHGDAASRHGAIAAARAFNTPLQTAQTGRHTGPLQPSLSFVALEPASLAFSALKKAEDRDSLILRFYNPDAQPVQALLRLGSVPAQVYRCDLAENRLAPLDPAADIALEAPPKKIITVELVP